MVATAKTWTSTLNNALDGADQRVQYRQVFFALYQALTSVGWIREWTCNGTTASAADNLPNAAAVTIGLNGSQPISYFVLRAPANFVRGGGTVRILVVTNESNVDTTPQAALIRMSRGAYDLHGTPLQNAPVPRVAERSIAAQMIPNTALTASSYHLWATTVGDVVLTVKPNAVAQMRLVTIITAPTTAIDNDSMGPLSAAFFQGAATGGNGATPTTLRIAANWCYLTPDGAAGTGGRLWSPLMDGAINWTNGLDYAGETCFTPYWLTSLGGAAFDDGRYMGYLVDIWSCPPALPIGESDTGDADAMRLVSIGGGVALPTTFAQLPFN